MARRVDPKKAEAERLQKEVLDMLRDEENKYCADCGAKTPRWASWNLGVFMCIRCAGIHRNLGVHISRVKSVNLDEWTEQQVAGMRSMGNERARDAYEAKLPSDFRRPHTDSGMEQFIRAKYEHKRYSNPNFERGSGRPAYKPSPASSAAAAPVSAPAQSANLLDFSAPPAAAAPVAAAPVQNLFDDFGSMSVSAPVAKAAAAPLDDPFASTGGDDDDPFGDFVGASVAAAPVAAAAPASVSPVSESAGVSLGGAGDLDILAPAAAVPEEKKSLNDIMSLFGPGTAAAAPAPPTYAPPMQQFGGVQQQQQQQQQMMGMQMGGMNGLAGLSMQGFGAPAQQQPQLGGAMMGGAPAGIGMPQMGGMSMPGMSGLPGAGFGGLPPAMAQQFAAASPFAAGGAGGGAGMPTSAPKKDPFADLGLGSMMGGGGGVQAQRKPSQTVNAGASGGGLIDISDFL